MIISFVLGTLVWNFHHENNTDVPTKSSGNGSSYYTSNNMMLFGGISIANAFQLSPPMILRSKYSMETSFPSFHVNSFMAARSGGSSSGSSDDSRVGTYNRSSSGRNASKTYSSSNPKTQITNPRDAIAGSSERTEVSRLKFVINQLRGNMQESEMRASAAENRVAMLQQQMKEMEGNKIQYIKENEDSFKQKKTQSMVKQQQQQQQQQQERQQKVRLDKLKKEHE
jgi:hypothetical protein